MPDHLTELVKKLQSSDKNIIKASIIEDLGRTSDPRAIRPLIEALNDTEMLVRWNTIKALSNFGEDAVIPLLKAMNNDDKFRRRNIVQALGEIGGDEALARLIRMLMFDETDESVLIEVIRALDKLRDMRAVEPLITVLKMDNWEMRFRAIHALEHIADSRAIEPLLEVLNTPDKDLKWAAVMAIESIKAAIAAVDQSEAAPPEEPKVARADKTQKSQELALNADIKPDRVTITVDGELFAQNIDLFTGYINGILATHKTHVELDMRRCFFIDSFALSRLNIIRKKLLARKRQFILTGLRPNVRLVFTATKLDQLFTIQ